ncbi:MAG: PIN domain-containing protein [Caldilineaceae bacterium]
MFKNEKSARKPIFYSSTNLSLNFSRLYKVEISSQVINEVSVNLLRKAHFAEEQVQQLIESFFAKYPVIEADKAIFLAASNLRQRYSFSYWDSLIVASALQAGVEVLYSEDMQHGLKVNGQLEIVNPFK